MLARFFLNFFSFCTFRRKYLYQCPYGSFQHVKQLVMEDEIFALLSSKTFQWEAEVCLTHRYGVE